MSIIPTRDAKANITWEKNRKHYYGLACHALSYIPRLTLTASTAYLLYINVPRFKEVNLVINGMALASPLVKCMLSKISLGANSFAITNIMFESTVSYLCPGWINAPSRVCLSFFVSCFINGFLISVERNEKKSLNYIDHMCFALNRGFFSLTCIAPISFACSSALCSIGVKNTMGIEYIFGSIIGSIIEIALRRKSSSENGRGGGNDIVVGD